MAIRLSLPAPVSVNSSPLIEVASTAAVPTPLKRMSSQMRFLAPAPVRSSVTAVPRSAAVTVAPPTFFHVPATAVAVSASFLRP